MFKKCKVVMLSTENQSVVFMKSNGLIEYNIHPPLHGINDLGWKYQHLYILSDEEIKDGDWMVDDLSNILQYREINTFWKELKKRSKKIISTTDDSLEIVSKGINPVYEKIPQPSQQFIEKYVESYNSGKPIEEVGVEYEMCETYRMDECNSRFHCCENPAKLKINPNNTINTKLVKDIWAREEVKTLFNRFTEFISHHDVDEWNQWVEKNL